jgi:hypothetical protein
MTCIYEETIPRVCFPLNASFTMQYDSCIRSNSQCHQYHLTKEQQRFRTQVAHVLHVICWCPCVGPQHLYYCVRLPSRMTRIMLAPDARHGASVPNGHCVPFFSGPIEFGDFIRWVLSDFFILITSYQCRSPLVLCQTRAALLTDASHRRRWRPPSAFH